MKIYVCFIFCLQGIYLRVGAELSGCGGLSEQTGSSGSFTSKNYPNNYDKNLACRWKITVPQNKFVVITFADDFRLDQSPGCSYDSVTIYDESVVNELEKNGVCKNSKVNHEGKYCGRTTPPKYTSKSNTVIIEFCSDDFIETTGFKLYWKESGDSSAKGCGETIILQKDTTGYIETVNFDGTTHYPTDHQCTWKIKAPEGMGVQLDAEVFELEPRVSCLFDRLLVHDGPDDKSPVMRAFCASIGPKGFVSGSNEIYLKFISDIANAGSGFRIKYSVTCSFNSFKCGSQCIPAKNYCDGNKDCTNGMDEALCHLTENKQCGDPDIKPEVGYKIFGGREARSHSWPWQVPLLNDGYLMCGGSIIAPQWILTASHCFEDLDDGVLSIRVGEHNLKKYVIEPNQKDYKFDNFFTHKDFLISTFNNDIALVKLKEPIVFNEHVKAVCLPKLKSHQSDNKFCYATGWGGTTDDFMSDTLQQVPLPTVSQATCNKKEYLHDLVTENMFCAGYFTGKQDTCQGDSGGPLVCHNNDDIWEIDGVTSWGAGCGLNRYPGIYTKVANYIDWIHKTMNEN